MATVTAAQKAQLKKLGIAQTPGMTAEGAAKIIANATKNKAQTTKKVAAVKKTATNAAKGGTGQGAWYQDANGNWVQKKAPAKKAAPAKKTAAVSPAAAQKAQAGPTKATAPAAKTTLKPSVSSTPSSPAKAITPPSATKATPAGDGVDWDVLRQLSSAGLSEAQIRALGGNKPAAGAAPVPTGPMGAGDIESYLKANYPDLVPYLQIPEIRDKVLIPAMQSLQRGVPWSSDQMQGALHATDWYRNTPDAERKWIVTNLSEPGSAAQQKLARSQIVNDYAARLGIRLDPMTVGNLAEQSLRGGWDDTYLRYQIASQMSGNNLTGSAISTQTALQATAADWGVKLNAQDMLNWTRDIELGTKSNDDYKALLQQQAQATYAYNPTLAGVIAKGISPGQFFQPYAELAQKELGIPTTQMQWTDPKFQVALNYQDPKGEMRPMNIDEWQKKIRSDPQYGWQFTSTADDVASRLEAQMLRMFGKVA